MQITCPDCGKPFETDTRSGEVECPHCGGKLPIGPSDAATISVVAGPKSSLSRAGVVGGVTLAADDAAATAGTRPASPVEDALSSAKGDRKYAVEDEIARGGMGVILKAIDRDIRRDVAMKLILGSPGEDTRVRFIQEAQVTGQLEHPNIVPIHDLGLDEQGRFFFTMKLVKGKSLEEVLDAVRAGEREAVGKYTLVHLLNIFTDVCNAMAFAHARGVVHRDLKPANIMLGDFGEVMVMDWGLAKVGAATHKAREHAGRREEPAGEATLSADEEIAQIVSSLRSEAGSALTMDGTIAGTPAYMPPEQARGEISKIDARSDVYSLGAILYEMLALAPPVEGETAYAMLANVADGNIDPPDLRAPGRHIPKELSAIAMKAQATDPKDRYQTVQRLRRDVQLFLEGRAVSAKPDTAWETLVKLVKRNRGASVATAVAAVVVASLVGVGYWLNLKERRKAEHAREVAEEAREVADRERRRAEEGWRKAKEESAARAELSRRAAPEFLAKSRKLTTAGKYAEALEAIDVAIGLDGSVGEFHLQKGLVLQNLLRFEESMGALVAAAERGAPLEFLNIKSCRSLESLDGLQGMQLKKLDLTECANLADISALRGMPLKELTLHRCPSLKSLDGLQGMQLKKLDLHYCNRVGDLSPLKDMPLEKLDLGTHEPNKVLRSLAALRGMKLKWLDLTGCEAVESLAPLRGAPLERLNLGNCRAVESLAPLQGAPLEFLNICACPGLRSLDGLQGTRLKELAVFQCRNVTDISPLRGLKIETLNLNGTSVADLSLLNRMPIKSLAIAGTRVTDLSPLKGVALTYLRMEDAPVTDLTPLAGMKLERLSFNVERITKGLDVVRNMKSITKISRDPGQPMHPADFWKKFDADRKKR